MQAACTHCGTEHLLKDTQFGGHTKVQFKCSKCGKSTIVDTKRSVDSTVVMSPLPSFARTDSPGSNVNLVLPDPGIRLPEKSNVVLGREGADIPLNDPEISRHHCLLEVRDMHIDLKDLDSTNGTFFDEERVRAAMLRDGTEFRIGGSLIRVNFQPK